MRGEGWTCPRNHQTGDTCHNSFRSIIPFFITMSRWITRLDIERAAVYTDPPETHLLQLGSTTVPTPAGTARDGIKRWLTSQHALERFETSCINAMRVEVPKLAGISSV